MRPILLLLLLPLIVITTNATALSSRNIQHVVVFGDSLSDMGYADRFPRPKGKLATYSNGVTWADYFTQAFLGRPSRANNLQPLTNPKNPKSYVSGTLDGNNYAAGGATTTGIGITFNTTLYSPPSTAEQINNYIKQNGVNGKISGNNLYILWAGNNDILRAYFKHQHDVLTLVPAMITAANNAADHVVNQVIQLHYAGAKHIIVINLPDSGLAPRFDHGIQRWFFTQVVTHFNNRLASALPTHKLGFYVMQFDTYYLLNQLFHSFPNGLTVAGKHFSFNNIHTPACGVKAALTEHKFAIECRALPGTQHYLFMDSVHPTTYAHQVIARFLLQAVRRDKRL